MRGIRNGVCVVELYILLFGFSFQYVYRPFYTRILSEKSIVGGENLQMVYVVPRI
jgi:hypothetical protein